MGAEREEGVFESAMRYKIMDPREATEVGFDEVGEENARHSSEGIRAKRVVLFDLE